LDTILFKVTAIPYGFFFFLSFFLSLLFIQKKRRREKEIKIHERKKIWRALEEVM